MSLNLSQKLDMLKLSEEGRSKAETGQKLNLLCQTVNQVVSAKEIFLIEIKFAAAVNTWIIRKSNSLTARMKKGVVARIKDQTSLNIPLNRGIIQSKFLNLFSSMFVCA